MLNHEQTLYLKCGLDKLPPWEHRMGPLSMCKCTEEELAAREEYSRFYCKKALSVKIIQRREAEDEGSN